MSEHLQVEQDGRLLRLTLNRTPDNGVSDAMAAQLSGRGQR